VTPVAAQGRTAIFARVRYEWSLPVTRFVFAIVIATGVAIWWLERFHVVAQQPLWVLVIAVVLGYLCSWTVHLVYAAAPSRGRLHLRIAVQVAVATILMYLTGWGPALTLGYLFVARDNLTVARDLSWRVIAIWVAAGLAVGQAAVSLGLAPSFVGVPDEYGLAALSALASLFVIGMLGISAESLAKAQTSLQRSEERLRTTLETANDAYVEIDDTGIVTDWNSQAEELFGWQRSEAIGRQGQELMLPEDDRDTDRNRRGLTELAATGEEPLLGRRFELLGQHRNGRTFPIELAFWRTKDSDAVRFHGFAHDITHRKDQEAALRKSQEDFRMLFTRHPHPMWVYDVRTLQFIEVNEAALSHYGYTRQEFLSMTIDQIRPPEDVVMLAANLTVGREGLEASGPWRHRTKAGVLIDVEIASHRLVFDGRDCILVMAQDISERRVLEDQLRHQALHDGLTDLPNRACLLERAELLLAQARRLQTPMAALFLDLDNFKEVNDSFGHLVGDELLQAVATRLYTAVREADTVGRIGGDEFVVLVSGASLAAGPEIVAQHLLDVVRDTPFYLEGRYVTVTASIGIAMGDAYAAADLLRNADVALYQAKARGKNCAAIFLPEMQSAVHERLEMAIDLHEAVGSHQFDLYYQPVVELSDLTLCSAEALLRWQHPKLGWVSPDRFVPLAEEIGVIEEVGRWVLEQACAQAAAWRRTYPWMSVAVNVSAIQLGTDRFVDVVREALRSSELDPAGLVLEITESTLMVDANATVRRLHDLKALGVRLAIDDFGTGFSSLSYLRQFPVDILKIDRSFLSTVTTSVQTAALVHTLIRLGEALGLDVIAEGIERPDQLKALQEAECPKAQGFLFAQPMPMERVSDLLRAGEPLSARLGSQLTSRDITDERLSELVVASKALTTRLEVPNGTETSG
jgi:diguanylate cyclase (GGDEF)-like protein/PAS domain S-box-containing protein